MKHSLIVAIVAGIGGALLHLGGLLLVDASFFEEASPPGTHGPEFSATLTPRESSQLAMVNRLLKDSSPLFMPTKWNPASDMSEVASLREAAEVFQPYQPRISLPLELEPVRTLFPSRTPVSFSSLLPQGSAFILSYFRRQDAQNLEPTSVAPLVVAKDLARTPYPVLSSTRLPEEMLIAAPDGLWEPFQCLLDLSTGKPTGIPPIEKSSGNVLWDTALQGYLHSFDFYRNLNNGYFRITIYP